MKKIIPFLILSILSCGPKSDPNHETNSNSPRIVSINGSISEILVEFGLENALIGVDATSTFPESLKSKTQIGNAHSMNMEQIIALEPTIVLSLTERGLKPEQATQLQQAGIKVQFYNLESNPESTQALITDLGKEFGKENEATALIEQMKQDIQNIPSINPDTKVLFIYARGAGAVQAAGDHTAMVEMIELAGAKSATEGQFEGFKALTPEALLDANPDFILLFETGFESLNGAKGLMEIPGMDKTNAGKHKRFITMDGQFLSGFGPRTGKAAIELAKALQANN